MNKSRVVCAHLGNDGYCPDFPNCPYSHPDKLMRTPIMLQLMATKMNHLSTGMMMINNQISLLNRRMITTNEMLQSLLGIGPQDIMKDHKILNKPLIIKTTGLDPSVIAELKSLHEKSHKHVTIKTEKKDDDVPTDNWFRDGIKKRQQEQQKK